MVPTQEPLVPLHFKLLCLLYISYTLYTNLSNLTYLLLLFTGLGHGGLLGLRLRRRFDVLPPQQEGLIAQVHQILTGHGLLERVPVALKDELLLVIEVDRAPVPATLQQLDVLACEEEVVTGLEGVGAGLWHLGGRVGCGAFGPDLVGVVSQELVGGVRDVVDATVGIGFLASGDLALRGLLVVAGCCFFCRGVVLRLIQQ